MGVTELSNKDLNWGRVVEPAWYRVFIKEMTDKPSKDGASINHTAEGEILFNGDNGSTEFAGVGLTWIFNSKAMGGFVALMRALGEDPKAGQKINTDAAKGVTIDVYVENDTYQGRVLNRINHKYRAIKPDVVAQV